MEVGGASLHAALWEITHVQMLQCTSHLSYSGMHLNNTGHHDSSAQQLLLF